MLWPDFIKSILILFPAAVGNASPILFMKLFPKLNYPLDFSREINGKRILGDHKTIRGLIGGIFGGLFGFFLIKIYANNLLFHTTSIYSDNFYKFLQVYLALPWYFGGIVGFGALLGDAVKSFFKRQANIPPGKSWFPFDQIDWIFGAVLVSMFFLEITFSTLFVCIIIGFTGHVISKALGYYLKLSDEFI